MAGKLKIKEIAQQTGVSISTVSRVLAGKANTSAAAKQKVLECAKLHGVLTEMSAGRLLFNTVTVFAPPRAFDVRTDIFYYKVLQGIRKAVAQQEVRVGFCALDEFEADVQMFLKRLNDPACETAIIIGIDDPHVHELAADIGKPCVLINCINHGMRLDVVSPDHHLIGECSANYLIEHGHTDILTLICLRRQTMERRLNGIREAFASHNIRFEDDHHLIATSGFGTEEAREAIATYFRSQPRGQYPTAILAGGDFMAMGAYEALQEMQLSVPGDVSIMSMDGFNLAEIHDLPLTAVHVPRDELGEEALRLLQLRMTRPDAPHRTVLLSGKVAVRGSVKRIGSKNIKAAVSTRNHGLYGS